MVEQAEKLAQVEGVSLIPVPVISAAQSEAWA